MLEVIVRLFIISQVVVALFLVLAFIQAEIQLRKRDREAAERWTIDPEMLRTKGVA